MTGDDAACVNDRIYTATKLPAMLRVFSATCTVTVEQLLDITAKHRSLQRQDPAADRFCVALNAEIQAIVSQAVVSRDA